MLGQISDPGRTRGANLGPNSSGQSLRLRVNYPSAHVSGTDPRATCGGRPHPATVPPTLRQHGDRAYLSKPTLLKEELRSQNKVLSLPFSLVLQHLVESRGKDAVAVHPPTAPSEPRRHAPPPRLYDASRLSQRHFWCHSIRDVAGPRWWEHPQRQAQRDAPPSPLCDISCFLARCWCCTCPGLFK